MTLPSGPTLFFETTAQRTAYSSSALSEGQLCYDQQTNSYYGWDGSAWTGISFDDVVIADDLTVGDDITLASGSVITWATDTNLYRGSGNRLQTDDDMWANLLASTSYLYANNGLTSQVIIGHNGSAQAAGILFGSANDTNLYRYQANILMTDDAFFAWGGLVGVGGGAYVHAAYLTTGNAAYHGLVIDGYTAQTADLTQWRAYDTTILTAIDKDGKLVFGPSGAQDTNLYRSAANTLKTDDKFIVADRLQLTDGNLELIQALGNAYLRSDLAWKFVNNDGTTVKFGIGTTGTLTFGSAEDTNLYRHAAGLLRTDNNFEAVGYIVAGGAGLYADTSFHIRAGVSIPTQLTANTDDWALIPTTASRVRASSDASRNLTGITGGSNGRVLVFHNVGAQNIVLVHDATSTAANRFYCPGSVNYTVTANSTAILVYDGTDSRWRVIGGVA